MNTACCYRPRVSFHPQGSTNLADVYGGLVQGGLSQQVEQWLGKDGVARQLPVVGHAEGYERYDVSGSREEQLCVALAVVCCKRSGIDALWVLCPSVQTGCSPVRPVQCMMGTHLPGVATSFQGRNLLPQGLSAQPQQRCHVSTTRSCA